MFSKFFRIFLIIFWNSKTKDKMIFVLFYSFSWILKSLNKKRRYKINLPRPQMFKNQPRTYSQKDVTSWSYRYNCLYIKLYSWNIKTITSEKHMWVFKFDHFDKWFPWIKLSHLEIVSFMLPILRIFFFIE